MFLKGNQDAEAYIHALECYLLLFLDQKLHEWSMFIHDGASLHMAHRVKQFFGEEEVLVLY